MSVLRIKRAGSGEAGILRRIKIKANGRVVAKVKPDEEASVDLPTGDYDVIAQMDWFTGGPVRVHLSEGDVVAIRVSLSFTKSWIGFVSPRKGIQVELVEPTGSG